MQELLKECGATRVVLEYNGMWQLQQLFQNLPDDWAVYQEMFFADATTFLQYNANMRSLVVDKLNTCELVVFNRFGKDMDKMEFHKIVRGVSRRTDIAYEYADGHVEYDEIEDPLPFDKNAAVIAVEDKDYALWYRDRSEDLSGYDGKTVRFTGQVVRERSIPKGCFLIGRPLMTCCAEDIRFAGLVCVWPQAETLKSRDWVTVEATIAVKKHECYGRVGPVLTAVSVAPAEKPENEVATFY